MAVSTDIKLSTMSYVILYVPDTNEALNFYRDKLGMKVKMEDGGWIELESGATTLALHKTDEKMTGEKRPATPVVVFTVEKIKEAYEALKTKGIKFSKEPHEVCSTPDHTGMSADFLDPYGNELSIFGMEPKK